MGYRCPYCNVVCYDNGTITKRIYESHLNSGVTEVISSDDDAVVIELSKCPNCQKTAVVAESFYKSKGFKFRFSYPPTDAKSFPDYVPASIRHDYMEAFSIVDLSPKASATLARRCLQGMIHDFWSIKEKNLNAEITALKPKLPASQWNAIDALRKIGNIGAHMEKDINIIVDVEPNEAKSLLKLIELLIDKWYVARHDEDELLAEIKNMSDQKEAERNSSTATTNGQ